MINGNTNRAEQIQDLLKRIHMNIHHVMIREMEQEELTMHQVYIMKIIKKNPKTNLTSLCSHLKLSKSAVSLMVNKLVEEGYVIRKENPADRRNVDILLSQIGERVLYEMRQRSKQVFSKLMSQLDEEELAEIQEKLLLLNESVEKSMAMYFD